MTRRRRITERLQVGEKPTILVVDGCVKKMVGGNGDHKETVLGLFKGRFKVNCTLKQRDKQADQKLRSMEKQLKTPLASVIANERVTGNDKVETTYYVYAAGTAYHAEANKFKMD